jgi:hypothetical protein
VNTELVIIGWLALSHAYTLWSLQRLKRAYPMLAKTLLNDGKTIDELDERLSRLESDGK